MKEILKLDIENIIPSHGEVLSGNAKEMILKSLESRKLIV